MKKIAKARKMTLMTHRIIEKMTKRWAWVRMMMTRMKILVMKVRMPRLMTERMMMMMMKTEVVMTTM